MVKLLQKLKLSYSFYCFLWLKCSNFPKSFLEIYEKDFYYCKNSLDKNRSFCTSVHWVGHSEKSKLVFAIMIPITLRLRDKYYYGNHYGTHKAFPFQSRAKQSTNEPPTSIKVESQRFTDKQKYLLII